MTRDDHDLLETETFDDLERARRGSSGRRVVTLTVLTHPQAARVGARARLPTTGSIALSRSTPDFDGAPLLTPSISRRPVRVERTGAGLRVDASGSPTGVRLDGDVVDAPVTLDPARLTAGVVVELGEQVVLLLHEEGVAAAPPPDFGMVGDSDGIRDVRAAVARHAPADGPVLIRGETGTGKELVARALHAASPRHGGPWLAVNMAAIPAGVAASELFGHARGAFSGASDARDGFFLRADGGTLFMDEIGATPSDVQAALLRALETGEIQPVGARALRAVDVRLVAATDLDLDAAMRAETFRASLYYRLATREIVVPPLRERRSDVGRLLVHFLREALEPIGRAARLEAPLDQRTVWLPGRLVARLARHAWPGNVRQLRGVALWLAGFADRDVAPADHPELDRLLGGGPAPPAPQPSAGPASVARPRRRRLEDIDDDEVLAAMTEHDYELGAAAKALGVSRPSMNALVDRHPVLTRAMHLSREEVARGRARAAREGVPLWRALRVSRYGLERRLAELGLGG